MESHAFRAEFLRIRTGLHWGLLIPDPLRHNPVTIITHALIVGLAATLVGLLAICIWIAIGSMFHEAMKPGDPLGLPVALLIGSGVTAAAFAALSLAGVVRPSAAAVSVVGAGVLVARGKHVTRLIASALKSYVRALPGKGVYLAGVTTAAILWLNAIAPPRDGDSMRYHLAHIRQIVQDEGWQPILDYHYALPFGWTLNYLPFELLHLPQAAQIVNAVLFVVVLGGILEILRERNVSALWTALATALVAHPFVVRTFTTANADGYAIFVVFTICALLLRADEMGPGGAIALGFVSWIGPQSRYQLVAVAMAALAAILLFRPADLRERIKPYLAGALAGLLLASPFYLVNYRTFGNPVWPLGIGPTDASSSYANIIGAAYTRTLSGELDIRTVWWGFERMFTTPELIPLPIAIPLVFLASVKSGRASVNRLVTFGLGFLILWVVTQPRLYPRFVILLIPAAALAGGLRFGAGTALGIPSKQWLSRNAVAVTLAALTLASASVSLDQIRYALTGNVAEYHRFTWYYPVYAWANRTLPPDARLLVIVNSGHSYYLERQYRRADPWLSAEVDWRLAATPSAIDSVLAAKRDDYVIYDDRDWSQFPGGAAMSSGIKQSIARGLLVPIHSFRVPLYTSRVRRRFEMANVYVLARAKAPPAGILVR